MLELESVRVGQLDEQVETATCLQKHFLKFPENESGESRLLFEAVVVHIVNIAVRAQLPFNEGSINMVFVLYSAASILQVLHLLPIFMWHRFLGGLNLLIPARYLQCLVVNQGTAFDHGDDNDDFLFKELVTKMFEVIDVNNDGKLDEAELIQQLNEENGLLVKLMEDARVNDDGRKKSLAVIDQMDKDDDGKIDFDEFKVAFIKLMTAETTLVTEDPGWNIPAEWSL